MIHRPIKLYEPTKTADGEGGFSESYSLSGVVYGFVRLHQAEMTLVYHSAGEVHPDWVVLADGGWYRVVSVVRQPGAVDGRAGLERINRPIVPED